MGLQLVCKQIETQRFEWEEGIFIGLRPFPQSSMVVQPDGTCDVTATSKRRWMHCLQYIEGLTDDAGEPIDKKLTLKINVNGANVVLKEALFDFPVLIGFPLKLVKWIQEKIDEITYPVEGIAKNLTSSQGGTQEESLASNAGTQSEEPEKSPIAEPATGGG